MALLDSLMRQRWSTRTAAGRCPAGPLSPATALAEETVARAHRPCLVPPLRLDEVRAFIENGWNRCANPEGDLTGKGPLFEVDLDDFRSNYLPQLEENDCVIVLSLQSTCDYCRAIEHIPAPFSTPLAPLHRHHRLLSREHNTTPHLRSLPPTRPPPIAQTTKARWLCMETTSASARIPSRRPQPPCWRQAMS